MYRLYAAGLAIILTLVVATAASAAQRSSQAFSGADPFSGAYDCGAFPVTYSGHDEWRYTNWYDAAGNPITQVGQIKSWETDVNSWTGKSIDVTTNLQVRMDFVAGTTTLSGTRNLSTVPGQGVVIQHVGRVVIGPDGQPISLSGKYPEFEAAYIGQDFCAALA
jgi:hypothetical protein